MRKFIISFCCYVFFIFTLAAQDKAPHYTVIVSLDASAGIIRQCMIPLT